MIFFVALFCVVLGIVLHSQVTPAPPPATPCQIDYDTLTDFSQAPCCVINGSTTSLLLVSGKVAGNYPVEPMIACAPLCENASYNAQAGTCTSGSSGPFQQCWQPITSVGCQDTALPIGVVGIQPYYLVSTDGIICSGSSACIPV